MSQGFTQSITLGAILASLRGLTIAAGDILFGSAVNSLTNLAKGAAETLLGMNSGATAPEWKSNVIIPCTLQGLVRITSKGVGATLTIAEMSGGVVLVTAAATIELPAVTVGNSVLIYGTTAAIVTVHPNANDRIVLDGVSKGDHTSIACSAIAGSFVALIGDSADGWTVLGKAGAWA